VRVGGAAGDHVVGGQLSIRVRPPLILVKGPRPVRDVGLRALPAGLPVPPVGADHVRGLARGRSVVEGVAPGVRRDALVGEVPGGVFEALGEHPVMLGCVDDERVVQLLHLDLRGGAIAFSVGEVPTQDHPERRQAPRDDDPELTELAHEQRGRPSHAALPRTTPSPANTRSPNRTTHPVEGLSMATSGAREHTSPPCTRGARVASPYVPGQAATFTVRAPWRTRIPPAPSRCRAAPGRP
jgi:hypothetical protein